MKARKTKSYRVRKFPEVREVQHRVARVAREAVNVEDRTVELSFSSEAPVERHFGVEILDHRAGAVRLGRLSDGGPVLLNHDLDRQIGVVESVSVAEGKGRVLARFSRSPEGGHIMNDIADGIRRNVSVGYQVHAMEEEKGEEGSLRRFRVTDWEPVEVSIVSVPADTSVGVGRTNEGSQMDEDIHTEEESEATPSISEVENEATKRERNRVSEIGAIVDRFRGNKAIAAAARQAIDSGTALDEFMREAMKLVSNAKPVIKTELGMSGKDVKRYSLFNVLRAQVERAENGTPLSKTAPYEFDIHRELLERLDADRADKVRGFLIPFDVQTRGHWSSGLGLNAAPQQSYQTPVGMMRAAPMDTTENVHLVSTDHLADRFIDALRASATVMAAGATTLTGLVGDVSIPKMGAVPFEWLAEDAAATAVEAVTSSVTLTPTTMAGHVNMTRRLLKQSSPDVENLIRDNIRIGAGREVDRVALIGAVGAEPTGVIGQSIGSVTIATLGAPTWAETVEFETDVETANALLNPGAAAYIAHPAVKGKMKTTSKDTGSGMFVWEGSMVNGYRAYSSTNTGHVNRLLFGDWSQLLIGFWGVLDLFADPFTDADRGRIYVRAFQDMDVAVRHPLSFSASTIA